MSLSSRARRTLDRWGFKSPSRRSRDEGPADGMSYRDIVWENAMEAYKSSPDPQIEVTPYIAARLEAAKHELLLKAHRMKREHDRRTAERRRRAAGFAAVASMLLATTGVASAVIGFSTGVPAVDKILGVNQAKAPAPGLGQGSTGSPAPENGKVLSGTPMVPIHIPLAQEDEATATGVAFTSQNKQLCYVLPHPAGPGASGFAGNTTCQPPDVVASEIMRDGFALTGTITGARTLVSGYASESVISLEIRGPHGPLKVSLSDAWSPGLSRPAHVRLFVGAAISDETDLGQNELEVDRALDLQAYEVTEHFSDGRVVTFPARSLTQ